MVRSETRLGAGVARRRRGWPTPVIAVAVGVLSGCGAGDAGPLELTQAGLTAVATQWSNWTTDGAPPTTCPSGSLVGGAKCRGRFCDDMAFQCVLSGLDDGETQWTDAFSEEGDNHRVCNGFVTGLACSGRYCDNLRLRCTDRPAATPQDCYWSAPLSEEGGGTFAFPAARFATGLRCQGRYCDNVSFYLCGLGPGPPPIPAQHLSAIAATFAPRLRFDALLGTGTAKGSRCFPGDAETYFDARRAGAAPTSLCNQDYSTIEQAQIPTYYVARQCGEDQLVIRYWFFYGWQSPCFSFVTPLGHHAADWESVAVKVVDGKLHRVAFFQHGKWYSRDPGHFETVDGTHVVSYVGRNSHGDYHDPGGHGGCLYWDDFRAPGAPDMHMDTWRNLKQLHRGQDAPSWMTCTGSDCFDGIGHPMEQTGELCAMSGCRGEGCSRSDVAASVPF